MEEKQLPFSCPLCGRKTDYPPDALKEGSIIVCPICKIKLTLHGHMWEDVQREMEKLKEEE